MLTIVVPAAELFDEVKQKFIKSPKVVLELEHSLVSISKWEAIWEKPFLKPEERTVEETISYIQAMSLDPDAPSEVFGRLTNENVMAINSYIDAKMTATWFREDPMAPKRPQEIITSELIYYWLVALNIPFECQHWHLNRLLTLVRVCNEKNQPEKKMSRAELAARNRQLNAQRKAQLNTRG